MTKKKTDDSYNLGTIEKMLNATPANTNGSDGETKKSKKRKESDKSAEAPKKRGRKKKEPIVNEEDMAPIQTTKRKSRKKKESDRKIDVGDVGDVGVQIPPKHDSDPKVYDLNEENPGNNNNEEDSNNQDVILQLPITEDEIETYSQKNKDEKQKFLDNVLLEYNPSIFDPKPIMQKSHVEDLDYCNTDNRSMFRPCLRCTISGEGSVIPCEDCVDKFNTGNPLQSIDDALMKRAEDDALYCRPDPTKFVNQQIAENKLPSDTQVEEYDPDVIQEFSNEPSPFVHGKIKCFEEVHASPFDDSHRSGQKSVSVVQSQSQSQSPSSNQQKEKNDEYQMSTSLPSAPVEEITSTVQFRVLNEFCQLDTWPKRTKVYCWGDSHPGDWVPVGIPIRYNKKSDNYMVYGNFCSFECAMAFKKADRKLCRISNDLFYDLRKRYGSLMTNLEKDQLNRMKDRDDMFSTIKSAEKRESLSIYGGKLSIQEFRKYSCMTTLSEKVYQFPLIPVNEIIEIVPKKYLNMELNRSNSPPLKLKRMKPLPGAKNTLEHTLLSHSRKSPTKKVKTK